MGGGKMVVRRLRKAKPENRLRLLAELTDHETKSLDADWPGWVHEGQEPPEGEDWRVWVMLAGRGFGKTRAGAEWVSQLARDMPGACFALVAANVDEARRVMVEGRSGLLAVARPDERKHIVWEPSRRRLLFPSGAQGFVYSGAHGESLRGPEHHFAWCDELAKWEQPQKTWDNLMLGLRLGDRPRVLVTTTPRPIQALKAIIGGEGVVRSGGATAANPHVGRRFVCGMQRQIGGTRLGRQELNGELIEEVDGALWSREELELSRQCGASPRAYRRVVIGVDPAVGLDGDACGIVACGIGEDGVAYVIGDHSAGGLSPEGWARKVAAAAAVHGAVRIVAEANNGGRMVEAVLRGAGVSAPVKLVHASEGKAARAAPVAALFESGRAKLAGRFPELEDEMCGLSWNGSYQEPGRSPDRADAMVWAMTDLMLGPAQAEPRIRML